jgi:hypothetical protein
MVDLAAVAEVTEGGIAQPWRFVVLSRYPGNRPQGELSDARTRKLDFKLRDQNQLTLTIDGRSPQLGWLEELRSDVVALRWSDLAGDFVPMFRGCITQTEDQISPTTHTVTLTATDYRGIMSRRTLRTTMPFQATEQAQIIGVLVGDANMPVGYAGASLGITGDLWPTGILRDRTYYPGQVIAAAIDDMSTDINGFDWSVEPSLDWAGDIHMWYPQRGAFRSSWVAHYGSTISNVARVVATSTFANYSMVQGAQDADGNTMIAESFGPAWTDGVAYPEGAWQMVTAAPDVSVQNTLQQSADGNVSLYGDLEPAYTLTTRAGRWSPDDCWLGDTVRLICRSGRLDVDTAVRITEIAIDVDDAGIEVATLTAGLAPESPIGLFKSIDRRLNRLEIR